MVIHARHLAIYRSFSSGSRVRRPAGWEIMVTTMAGTMATIGDGISGNGEIMATTMAGSMATTRDGISGPEYGDILKRAVLWAQGLAFNNYHAPYVPEVSQYGDNFNLNRLSPSNSCTSTGLCPIWFGGS